VHPALGILSETKNLGITFAAISIMLKIDGGILRRKWIANLGKAGKWNSCLTLIQT